MTVVDVNTGKFTGSGGNLEETVTKNNLEAAEEIVRQLRLRDIGGIIVIDFIDMVLELNRDLVLRRLVECLGRDRTKHQVAEVTSLGLVQMTRKRIGTGLLEAFSENCDHCGGRGLILHDEPKESRRRSDDGRSRGGQQNQAAEPERSEPVRSGSGGGQQNQGGGQNGPGGEQKNGDGEGAKKTSRSRGRGRGRGRGEGSDEHAESEAPSNGDAAQKLAQIAAATLANGEKANGEQSHDTEHGSTDQQPAGRSGAEGAQNDSQNNSQNDSGSDAGNDQSGSEPEKSEQNSSGRNGSTRRRRSSRSRSNASSNEGDAGNSGADQPVSAPELASTPV